MNSAPAELLHPLSAHLYKSTAQSKLATISRGTRNAIDAALQLWIDLPRSIQIGSDGTTCTSICQKKRRHFYASVGILFTKNKSFEKENAAITDEIGLSGVGVFSPDSTERRGRLLFINLI